MSVSMDDNGGSDLSIEELMKEYSSRPAQVAQWLWCLEYVAKFHKDKRYIHEMLNMGSQYSNVYGRRIDEILSLRALECIFDPSKNDSTTTVDVASTSGARVEFDISLSNAYVLRTILKEIQVSELRVGMPELSKFNVLPFIAHKNMCLQQCAFEKLRDLGLLENHTNPASPVEANDPVFRKDSSVNIDEPQVIVCVEQNINEKVKEILKDDEDELMDTNHNDEVVLINGDELITNDNTTCETVLPGEARVKCTKEGIWLISVSDDDDDDDDDDETEMVRSPALIKTTNTDSYTNLVSSSSRTGPKNLCWKCGKGGTLLICSRSECASKVHRECLKCAVNVDEEGNFHCPVCWYDLLVEEYIDSQKLISYAKIKLDRFMHLLSRKGKSLSR